MKDVVESPQLADRGFWQDIEHPELNDTISYPGYPIKMSENLCGMQRRAPLIGEHNVEIYGGEMGLSEKELAILKTGGVI
jgi:crotonobetainyl-CoA:carnitine CoA-transferase CaiB-like acyl-CoA transferase